MKYTLVTLPLVMLLLTACGSETPTPAPVKKTTKTVERQVPQVAQAPKSTHKPKEVKDTNYETTYMYPEDNKKKKEKVTTTASTAVMTKDECVEMITQEKFDKYTAMFGSEEASIKRCQMIKAMNS
jgi:hypothetical protein